jgi:pimeloyl-ACP methyl ester carboxylesterase
MNIRLGALAILGLSLIGGPVSDAAGRQDLKALLPDGRHLHFACSGEGSPTVILESGFGATADAWFKVQPELARETRVCSYDRAGYGSSDPGPAPRDGAAIAADLDQGLRAARIAGPFVLVGHSAGGLYVQIFAELRPQDVEGMVLVDPSVAYQDQRFADFGPGAGSLAPLIAAAATCVNYLEGTLKLAEAAERDRCSQSPPHGPGAVAPIAFWRTEVAELDTLWGLTSDETPSGPGTLGAMPVVVLTRAGDAGAPADARWTALHQELAARSTVGVEHGVAGSTHLMMIDHPDAVIAAVREVIAASHKR